MKKIDENGKLFGKISIIDLAFIICLVILVIFTFLKTGINKNDFFIPKEEYLATYKVTGATESFVKSLSLNDKVYSETDKSYIGTIEKIDVTPAEILTKTIDGKMNYCKSPNKFDIILTISHKGHKDSQKGLVISKGYNVQANLQRTIYTRYVSFASTVIDIKAKK